MAEEKKTNPTPEERGPEAPPAPEVPEAPPAVEQTEQGVIPGMEGPPAPSGKVIDLSSVRQEQPPGPEAGPAPEGGQEWEKPQEEQKQPRRGRRPKDKEAPAQEGKPKRRGRPPKEGKQEKQTPGGGGAGKGGRSAKAAERLAPAPVKEEAPPPPAPERRPPGHFFPLKRAPFKKNVALCGSLLRKTLQIDTRRSYPYRKAQNKKQAGISCKNEKKALMLSGGHRSIVSAQSPFFEMAPRSRPSVTSDT